MSAPTVLDRYGQASRRDRLHVRLRWASCPFAELERWVVERGRVLDLGCGHGSFALHLADGSTDRAVVGVDLDETKIAVARAAAATEPVLANVDFVVGTDADLPAGDFDTITVIDVLYLLPPADQEAVVTRLAGRLRPGGRLIVKEMAPKPAWKREWSHLQELVATRVVRITKGGDNLVPPAPASLGAWMEAAGLRTEDRSLARGYPWPHHVVVGTAG